MQSRRQDRPGTGVELQQSFGLAHSCTKSTGGCGFVGRSDNMQPSSGMRGVRYRGIQVVENYIVLWSNDLRSGHRERETAGEVAVDAVSLEEIKGPQIPRPYRRARTQVLRVRSDDPCLSGRESSAADEIRQMYRHDQRNYGGMRRPRIGPVGKPAMQNKLDRPGDDVRPAVQ